MDIKSYFIIFWIIFAELNFSQQVDINRIEQMPNFPQPYIMRDWKNVAIGYDSLVFNFDLTGNYLPLGSIKTITVNYPEHNSFVLHTVVGTPYPNSGEAINCLPAVIGASLVGIDKSNSFGQNWVLMSEEWFNNRPEQNIYKNHPVDDTYNDWWYITMPNVFFYQLYDLYPNTGDFDYQFISVADQWLKAVEVLGGNTSPWTLPDMNYRGFDFQTMTPYSGDPAEPESAGAIAWLLYNAYVETHDEKYRVGAELAMEYLNSLTSNPSYELQLPYGSYIAARMNAELGTDYDVQKIINWCFDVGPIRNWGAIIGNWDNIDVSGLIGETIVNDYVFAMNTFEQIGALVPLVRYDDRFARAIGKWVLNAANACRLFYPNYLPGFKQDSEEWAYEYDTNSYIAHEGMREEGPGGWSPYATGDAISGGWGETNLALYGSSHVGILGGIIDTTNVEGILKLDVLKTDYFNEQAHQTYLLFNPFNESKSVNIHLGEGNYDIYESLTNTVIASNKSNYVELNIPPDEAFLIVLVPSGANWTIELNHTLADDIIIDYNSDQIISNYPPRIKSLSSLEKMIGINNEVHLYCTATDRDGDILSYVWDIEGGEISGSGSNIIWKTPVDEGIYKITVTVNDNNGGVVSYSMEAVVQTGINTAPIIEQIIADQRKIGLGGSASLNCIAKDDDGDQLMFEWESNYGTISSNNNIATWEAPTVEGNYFIRCKVTDENGSDVSDSISVSVRDLTIVQNGNLICYYPFNNNAVDESSNSNNGVITGAQFQIDRFDMSNSALYFDGVDDNIIVPNNSQLNFTESITLNFWMEIDNFFDREQYLISHGNWENRWKISISNKRLRWTVKTETGITDLDSETILKLDSLYNVTVVYSGSDMEIYINGKLDAFKYWGGQINQTTIDLSIGQSLPGDNNYCFNGVLDDIRIYDYALPLNEITALYDLATGVGEDIVIINTTRLFQNYPNPFNNSTVIKYQVLERSLLNVSIFNSLGQKVNKLVNSMNDKGIYEIYWNGEDTNGKQLATGIYYLRLKSGDYILTKKMLLLK